LWLRGLFGAYTIDKKKEGDLRRAMLAQIQPPPPKDGTDPFAVDAEKKCERDREEGPLRSWNTRSQILTTVALGYLAYLVVVAKSCGSLAARVLLDLAAIAFVVVCYMRQKKADENRFSNGMKKE
jgi:hypothetical protein